MKDKHVIALTSTKENLALDALGNPVRRQILQLIATQPQNVNMLASAFPISRPAISRHLSLLKQAGFLTATPDGTQNIYSINSKGFDASRSWLDSFWDDAEARLRLLAENVPESNI
jgi:DNA-binding transcriptional ArsR family regulator